MPAFLPFRGLHYRDDLDLRSVTAPPYDVLSADDRRSLADSHPNSVVHVDVPIGDDPYATAARTFTDWQSSGILVRDPAPSFTLYRMEFVDAAGRRRRTVGVVGALEVVDEGSGEVLPHERTTPKATTDRLDLTRATRANLSPVWGLSLREQLSDALLAKGTPMGSFVDDDGVTHGIERIDDPDRVRSISRLVSSAPVLIADGHHRYGVARTYRNERRADGDGSDAETTLTYVAELVEDQLSIAAIHRLYRSITVDELRDVLGKYFVVVAAGRIGDDVVAEMDRRGALCLVAPSLESWWLSPREGVFGESRNLDSDRLEVALRAVAHDVAYQHGVTEVCDHLQHGHAEAAILIRPTGIDEIRRTADERLLMPPKSTFFTPKLRTGMVFRTLEE
ncbi:MAG: DUF1015 family protein [Ilumatobacteraceae bacterium]